MEYINSIKDTVSWLGYKPWKVTFSSDRFTEIYNFAVALIKKGKAYVCACDKAEVSADRAAKKGSKWRNRPVQENLDLFEEMRLGLHAEGSLSLRLKIDPSSENPTLRDPHIYRIRYTPHPHAGDKWCLYPLYDFTHCKCML